jgi:hypothetical protein
MIDIRQSIFLICLLNAIGGVIAFQTPPHFSSPFFERTTSTASDGLRDSVALHAASSTSKEEAIQDYCQLVQSAIDDEQFVSLYLKGPSKKKGTKEELRGCLATVQGRLVEIQKKKSSPVVVLQSTFKYHGATDVAKNWELVQVGESLQDLLLSTDDGNDYKSEWGTWHASGTPLGLASCTLVTTTQTTDFVVKSNKMRTRKTKPDPSDPASTSTVSTTVEKHDRTKQVPVSQEAPFWQAIGLTKKPAKRRQCQKFVEIVGNLVQKQIETTKTSSSISTVDMGCGRGYLTFALHHYLQETYAESAMIQTRGIDMRPKLVTEMNTVVSSLGDDMAPGLLFETGTIESFLEATTRQQTNDDDLQVLIALHACDTATDDAIWSGIQLNADILVVAPCCHKQVRPQLDRIVNSHPLKDVLRHGIYRERMAETVTDAMRALLLELAHYQVQVFEFIGGEHTAKNVMITAVKLPRKRSEKDLQGLRQRLHDLAQLNGIRSQKLAEWMEEELTVTGEGLVAVPTSLSAKAMPPL